jgi:hypothetical protein
MLENGGLPLAHTLATSCVDALALFPAESMTLVASALVVALRQLYHSCAVWSRHDRLCTFLMLVCVNMCDKQGLLCLLPFQLHKSLAIAIDVIPPEAPDFLRLELVDSLLNFASTPKGYFC